MSFNINFGGGNNNGFGGYRNNSNRARVAFPNPFAPGPRGRRARIGFIVFGVLWLLLANFLLSFIAAESKQLTATTTGTVTSIAYSYSSSSSRHNSTSTTCTLTTRYRVAGRTYEQRAITGTSGDCSHGVGQPVAISYNPANPGHYMLTADKGAYGVMGFLLPAIGIVLIVLGALGFALQLGLAGAALALFAGRRRS